MRYNLRSRPNWAQHLQLFKDFQLGKLFFLVSCRSFLSSPIHAGIENIELGFHTFLLSLALNPKAMVKIQLTNGW